MSALALGLANVSPRFLTDHNFLKTILNYTSLLYRVQSLFELTNSKPTKLAL
jgi:hypothetical protein